MMFDLTAMLTFHPGKKEIAWMQTRVVCRLADTQKHKTTVSNDQIHIHMHTLIEVIDLNVKKQCN